MKINQKYIQYILLLLIVVIGFCAYQFGYVKFIEKANQVKTENKAIEARINELNDKEQYRSEWTDAITKSDDEIKQILAKYGPGNTPEKSIIFARDLETNSPMQISNISFNPDVPIFVSEDTDENGNPKVEIDSTYISIDYATTYDGLKNCMDFINNYKERINVNGFTTSVNQETGQLAGNMIISMYSVKDADHIYKDPVVPNISIGTENIFGSGYEIPPVSPDLSEGEGEEPEAQTGETEGEGGTE